MNPSNAIFLALTVARWIFSPRRSLTQELADLPQETLRTILEANVSAGLYRRFESEIPFEDRSHEDVYGLVVERVVEPEIVQTWSLFELDP